MESSLGGLWGERWRTQPGEAPPSLHLAEGRASCRGGGGGGKGAGNRGTGSGENREPCPERGGGSPGHRAACHPRRFAGGLQGSNNSFCLS